MDNFIIRPTKDFFKHSIIEPEDNRVIKKDGYIIKPTKDSLIHSAKGSQWEKYDYIAVKDGKYYYPDDYEGGRHLPKDRRQIQQEAIKETAGEPQGWEQAFYGEWEKNLKTTGGKLDPKTLQEMLMFGTNKDGSKYDNFAVALAEMAGIDADKIKPEVLNRMRLRAIEHYEKEFEQEKDNFDKEGNRIKDRSAEQQNKISKSSKKSTKTGKKASTKKTDSKKTSGKSLDSSNTTSTKSSVDTAAIKAAQKEKREIADRIKKRKERERIARERAVQAQTGKVKKITRFK